MGANVEIKAKLTDRAAVEERARALADAAPRTLRQEDVFFTVARGRLKLRTIDGARGELIAYERPDAEGPKASAYTIFRTDDPDTLLEALSGTLGASVVVRKVRTVYLAGRTRIHLDAVEGLGEFLELERVLAPGEDPRAGERDVRELMARLGVAEADLVAGAYADLLAWREGCRVSRISGTGGER